jgi:hypothetical protein
MARKLVDRMGRAIPDGMEATAQNKAAHFLTDCFLVMLDGLGYAITVVPQRNGLKVTLHEVRPVLNQGLLNQSLSRFQFALSNVRSLLFATEKPQEEKHEQGQDHGS